MKIGIIGFGAIGFDVAKKLDKEKDQFDVIGVHSRTKNKIIEKTPKFIKFWSNKKIAPNSNKNPDIKIIGSMHAFIIAAKTPDFIFFNFCISIIFVVFNNS